MSKTQNVKKELVNNMDIVKYIQSKRMHTVALKCIMNKDIKEVSSWFGYKRDIKYTMGDIAETPITGDVECFWDVAENLSVKGKEVLDKIAHRVQEKREASMIRLVKEKFGLSAGFERSDEVVRQNTDTSLTFEP